MRSSPINFNDARFQSGNRSYVISLFAGEGGPRSMYPGGVPNGMHYGGGSSAMNYAFDRTIFLNIVRPTTKTVGSKVELASVLDLLTRL